MDLSTKEPELYLFFFFFFFTYIRTIFDWHKAIPVFVYVFMWRLSSANLTPFADLRKDE